MRVPKGLKTSEVIPPQIRQVETSLNVEEHKPAGMVGLCCQGYLGPPEEEALKGMEHLSKVPERVKKELVCRKGGPCLCCSSLPFLD